MATYKPYRKTDSAGTLEEIKIPYSSVDGTPTIPTKVSQLTNDSGFTTNKGTVTSVAVKMNGATKGTVTSSGTIDLGTVLTSHQDISGKANLSGGNTFTGKQTLNSPASDGYSINAAGYIKGSWLQASSIANKGANTGKVCVFDNSGWIYYRTPTEILAEAGGATTNDVSGKLDKTTYEVNKTINFGSSGVLCVGKFKVYDTNVTCEITSTTSVTYSGKLVIATQNNVIQQMTVYGDAANTVAPNFFIKPSTTSDPYIEVYFKPSSWSKNVIHIYGSAIAEAPTDVCTNVSAVPSTATQQPINALTNTFAQKSSIPTKTSQLTNDSGYTTNKGTVTQVKINGTTKSPNSAGLVDLGTISGGGSMPTPIQVATGEFAEETPGWCSISLTPLSTGWYLFVLHDIAEQSGREYQSIKYIDNNRYQKFLFNFYEDANDVHPIITYEYISSTSAKIYGYNGNYIYTDNPASITIYSLNG